MKLVRFFLHRGHPRAEELADETLDRVSRKLAGGEVIRAPDIGPYVLGVGRNVLREAWAKPAREVPLPDDHEPPAPAPAEDGEHEPDPRSSALTDCLQRLPPEHRQLLLDYYQGSHGAQIPLRKSLADRLGVGKNALRIRVHRLRARLEECVRSRNGIAGGATS